MTAFTEFILLSKGGLFIIYFSIKTIGVNDFFGIAKSYVNIIPINIVGFIDPNYIECYHNKNNTSRGIIFIILIL